MIQIVCDECDRTAALDRDLNGEQAMGRSQPLVRVRVYAAVRDPYPEWLRDPEYGQDLCPRCARKRQVQLAQELERSRGGREG